MKTYIFPSVLMMLILICTSCEEVIDINLNSISPAMVFEAVHSKDEKCQVKLSYTSDYFTVEDSKTIDDAVVTLYDNLGQSEVLEFVADGTYIGKTMVGVENVNYTLSVLVDGNEYKAESFMFAESEILAIEYELWEDEEDEKEYNVTVTFKDNIEEHNFYMLEVTVNDELLRDQYYLVDDKHHTNTGQIEFEIDDVEISKDIIEQGSQVTIGLYSIDEDTYRFYYELNQTIDDGLLNSSTPFTPKSNFSVNILGHFSAWSYTSDAIVIAE